MATQVIRAMRGVARILLWGQKEDRKSFSRVQRQSPYGGLGQSPKKPEITIENETEAIDENTQTLSRPNGRTGRNRTGPPWSVGRQTAGGPPAGSVTDPDRRR